MKPVTNLWKIVIHPRRTSRELLEDGSRSLYAAGGIVLGFAAILALLFLYSHLAGDYPPPPDELETWIATWGEFTMLPFVKIPAESYRLAQAIFIIPLVLGIWILMAGSARLLSVLFGGHTTFEQYLSLFGFSFFAFWILAQVLELVYSVVLGGAILPALRMEYGPLVRCLAANYPSFMWTLMLTLGGIYNGIVTYESERLSAVKAGLTGATTLVWPIVLIAVLVR